MSAQEFESLMEKARALKRGDDSLADGKDLDAMVVPLSDNQRLIVVPCEGPAAVWATRSLDRRASIRSW